MSMAKAKGPSEIHEGLLVFQGPGPMYLLNPPLIGSVGTDMVY